MRIVPLMANFIGKRIWHVREPLSEMEKMSRMATRQPVKFEPPGERFKIIMTNDVDPRTGKLYPDYEARRAARRKADKSIVIDLGNCYPEDF